MQKKITISELNRLVRASVERAFFGGVWIVGEVRQFKIHSSGHWYFVMRDKDAQVDCVMWRGDNAQANWIPQNGIEVEAQVIPTIYEKGGRYQVMVKKILPGGKGARAIAFEILKKKLDALGLFEPSHKKALPPFPLTIGVATSRTGAAIRDILNVLRRRAPWITVILRDTKVQGESAAPDIIGAIEEFNKYGTVDLLIIGRGGGSEDDLWCFNDEGVANAIYNSQLPIISAVGHEIDFTISDFVADMRAPTPSAAAEIAVPDRNRLISRLASLLRTAATALSNRTLKMQTRLQQSTQKMAALNPAHKISELRQRIDWLYSNAHGAIFRKMESQEKQLEHLSNSLTMLSPKHILARGFSIVRKNNRVIRSNDEIEKNDAIDIEFYKGTAKAIVKE